MPLKSFDMRYTDYPVQQKRGSCALFLTSGEGGFGLCPIPSESFQLSIFAVFKVHLSLFF